MVSGLLVACRGFGRGALLRVLPGRFLLIKKPIDLSTNRPFSGPSCSTGLAAGGGPHTMLNCVFCRVSGFPHGVEGQFGLQGGVGVSRRVWGATYSRRWERANSMKLSQCRGGPPGDAARGGRAAWKSVKKRPRKRTPTKSGRYSEGHPRKGPKSGSSQGAKPPPPPPQAPPPERARGGRRELYHTT